MKRIKNIALFFVAPFIALGYVIILPLYGMWMIGRIGFEALSKTKYITNQDMLDASKS